MKVSGSSKIKIKVIGALGCGLFLAAVSILSFSKIQKTAFAAEPTDSSYFTFDESTGAITDYSLDGPKDVVIPEEINGVQVTSIAQSGQTYSSFQGKNLTSVVFPQTIKSIGSGAFANNNLTELTLPDSLEELSAYVFY